MSKCLVVIDFQNDFVDGSLGSEQAIAIADNVRKKIETRRQEGYDIIFTLDTHGPDYLQTNEGRHLPVEHCIRGTYGHDLYPCVAQVREETDYIIEKPSFGSIELFTYLQSHPYDEIELVGVATDICVLSNAVLAKTAQPEANVKADAACMAGTSPETHDAAIRVLGSLQVEIENAPERAE